VAQVGLNIAPSAVGNNKVSADSCEVIDLDFLRCARVQTVKSRKDSS
jgi:hypothetical protein